MRRIVTFCALVGLCAPVAAHAQGKGRGREEARAEREQARSERDDHDERGEKKGKEKDKDKDDDKARERSEKEAERHGNGRHLGHQLGRGHHKGRGRGHEHHDHDQVASREPSNACVDANRDGRCDFRTDSGRVPSGPVTTPTKFPLPRPVPAPVPGTEPTRGTGTTTPTTPRVDPTRTRRALPEMVPVTMLEQKRRTRDQEQWLGAGDVANRYVDANQDGVPERITWLDRAGMVKQVWRDDDRNGRADAVAVYENGRLTHMVRE